MQSALQSPGELTSALQLKGQTVRWGSAALIFLGSCVAAGLWLRLRGLGAEGFADDEIHKWLAANRYLQGDFWGDDLEHPMLMKSLIALALVLGKNLGWTPEAITRLPNALAGGVGVIVIALLGRRLFGRATGLFAAAMGAVSVSWVGYQRIAKEDTLLGLFLMVLCLCLAEAKAAADAGEDRRSLRFEIAGAAALAAMFASKYYFFLFFIPVVAVLWIVRTGTRYRVSGGRWLQLIGLSFLIWVCLDWVIVFPSTWTYLASYFRGGHQGGRAIHLTMLFMGRLYPNLIQSWLHGMSPWFYFVFAAVKETLGVFLFAIGGLVWAVWKRHPSQRLLLAWMGVWFLLYSASGGKYARLFVPVMPAFFLLAGSAAAAIVDRARATGRNHAPQAVAILALACTSVPELVQSITHAPYLRTYVSLLGGGDRKVTWYFPHCDYYDAGFREAIQHLAQRAEPGAEVSSEVDWVARYYAHRFGREDFVYSLVRQGQACRQRRTCYVLVQVGRLYQVNQDAIDNLALRQPWHVVRIRDVDVVKVYRLAADESPFPERPISSR